MVVVWRVQMFLCNYVYQGICHDHTSSVTMQNFSMGLLKFILAVFIQHNPDYV